MRGAGTIALSLGLCLCAGQLVASSPASAAAATPITAAAASAKVRPVVKTTYSTRKIKSGAKVKVTAKYINPVNGKVVTSGTVRLQAFRKGKWVNQTSKNLGKSGSVALTMAPKASGYLRAVYAGSSKFTSLAGGKTYISVAANGNKVINEAKKHVGSLYKFGAAGPTRFDCSGYTMWVYKKTLGVKLPHKANLQQRYGKSVSKSKKQIGDLIVFRSGSYGSHVGIYAGSGYMYDSPHTGARVSKRKIYGSNYVVRRLA